MEICGDLNALSGNGEALLHVACLEAPGSTIDWLIAHGADASLLTSFVLGPSSILMWLFGS